MRGGAYSLTSVEATGSSAPSPRPTTSRSTTSEATDHASADAPVAYPELHHLTAPLRQAGRAAGDPGLVNLWAGQTYELGRQLPAGQLVRTLGEEARAALQHARERLRAPAGGIGGEEGSGAERP